MRRLLAAVAGYRRAEVLRSSRAGFCKHSDAGERNCIKHASLGDNFFYVKYRVLREARQSRSHMKNDKRWTYKQITDAAETEIRRAMQKAKDAPQLSHMYHQHARGVYALWNEVTSGWIKDGDIERLHALMRTE